MAHSAMVKSRARLRYSSARCGSAVHASLYCIGLMALLCFSTLPAAGQRYVERGILINPLATVERPPAEDSVQFLPGTYGFGELFYTFDDSVQAWSQRLLLTVELVRFSARQTLSFNTNIEFVADPNNSIGFNPRAIWFEENLMYTQQQAGWLWQVAYNHRCKHDIDNLSENTQRGLIYGSLSGRIVLHGDEAPRPQFFAALRTDVYTLLADDRSPIIAELIAPDFDHLAASLGAMAHWNSGGDGILGWYGQANALINFFGTEAGFSNRIASIEDVAVNWGLEAGIELRGNSRMQIGARIEHFHDAEVLPIPTERTYFSIGVRIFEAGVFW